MSGDKRTRSLQRWLAQATKTDSQTIDELYGLEPLFEPEGAGAEVAAIEFVTVDCPYCGESFDTRIDLSVGSFSYIEDCQICCRPIEIEVKVNAPGEHAQVTLRRSD